MRFKLGWLRAIEYFLLGYLVSTVVSFASWFIFQNIFILFWATRMALMPLVFYYLAKLYLQRTKTTQHEGRRLAIFWLALLVIVDFGVYIVVVKFKILDVYVFVGQPWLIVTYLLAFLAPWVAEARMLKLESKPPV
jgi:hypothetical protein